MDIIGIYLIIINAVSFVLMLVDKYNAQNRLWRIPEFVLMTFSAIGGSLGTFLAMKLIRHKTLHPKFYIGVPAMIAVHLLILWDLSRFL